MEYVFQILIIFVSPWILNKYLSGRKISNYLSPVVMAYIIGILVAMFNLVPMSDAVSKYTSELSIMVAIPMLLFSADIMGWLKQAKAPIISFFAAVLAALISTSIFAFVFRNDIDNSWQQAGMLMGVFTGGTANMQAVSVGINAPEQMFVILNAAEIFWGGVYLLFLTSVAHQIYGKFLPEYKIEDEDELSFDAVPQHNYGQMVKGSLLSLLIVIVSLGAVFLIFGNLSKQNLIIILLTSFGVGASFFKSVRKLEGSFVIAEYLLLVFCVAAGMRTDFLELINTGGNVVLFAGAAMFLTASLHLLISWLFKIDRDTTIIMATATVYGPAFIGQLAKVMNNKHIIFIGMASGIMGYVVGNYLGIGMSYLLEYFIAPK